MCVGGGGGGGAHSHLLRGVIDLVDGVLDGLPGYVPRVTVTLDLQHRHLQRTDAEGVDIGCYCHLPLCRDTEQNKEKNVIECIHINGCFFC